MDDFSARTVKLRDQTVKLQIWDTVRQENFQSITRQFYRAAVAAILVFDVTRRETFRHIESWMEQVK